MITKYLILKKKNEKTEIFVILSSYDAPLKKQATVINLISTELKKIVSVT